MDIMSSEGKNGQRAMPIVRTSVVGQQQIGVCGALWDEE